MIVRVVIVESTFCEAVGYIGKMWYSIKVHSINTVLCSTVCYIYSCNVNYKIRKRKANWIGHILHRNCLLKQVIEGKIKGEMEVARR